MNKALREDLKLWHLVLGFVVFALGGAVSLGMTYQKINDRLDDYRSGLSKGLTEHVADLCGILHGVPRRTASLRIEGKIDRL